MHEQYVVREKQIRAGGLCFIMKEEKKKELEGRTVQEIDGVARQEICS